MSLGIQWLARECYALSSDAINVARCCGSTGAKHNPHIEALVLVPVVAGLTPSLATVTTKMADAMEEYEKEAGCVPILHPEVSSGSSTPLHGDMNTPKTGSVGAARCFSGPLLETPNAPCITTDGGGAAEKKPSPAENTDLVKERIGSWHAPLAAVLFHYLVCDQQAERPGLDPGIAFNKSLETEAGGFLVLILVFPRSRRTIEEETAKRLGSSDDGPWQHTLG
ncbi:hypothetical protein CCH79_00014347 [Gambusia affinis]|uniref:Uncharacterized protein n=1 Tax=Gambusia affinis TaxID=33528 RepID=A0A315USS3_GAMAF|nr:hypothetical protein CCH79_00014347 [Gambusia affinis]